MTPQPEFEHPRLFYGYLKWDNNPLEYIDVANTVGKVAVEEFGDSYLPED